MTDKIVGWHFANETLRDGSSLPPRGEVLSLPESMTVVACKSGYHASERVIDALQYAPGPYVARVRVWGEIQEHGCPVDKIVGRHRETLTSYVDVTTELRSFARWLACGVMHLWDLPATVREYLTASDADAEQFRVAAWAAARDAAGRAAWAAARDAAGRAASDAAWAEQNAELERRLRVALGEADD